MKEAGIFNRVFLIGLLASCIGMLMSPSVTAADTQLQVLVSDVCPNIPGNQPTMPSGMQQDSSGNCFTPAPPSSPDACPNLDGSQEAIPKGYYRDRNGNCVLQTRPPQDVCPNLDAAQSAVPDGMLTASNGDCVWPLKDLCANIPGPQDMMPSDMKYDDSGNCYTPSAPAKGPTERPGTASPAPSWVIPYYLIGALAFLALLLIGQMVRESWLTQGIIILFKRKKHIAEEKDEFIAVTAHYLRSTLSAMLAGLATLVTLKDLTEDEATPLMNATQSLRANVETVLSRETSNALENGHLPASNAIHVSTLISPLFWLPTVLTAIGLVVINLLLTRFSFEDKDVWLQLAAFVTAGLLLFFTLRARHIRHLKRQGAGKLIEGEQAIDAVRNTFIQNSASVLSDGLQQIDLHRRRIAGVPSSGLFHEGYSGLVGILEKLSLLRMVATGTSPATKFDIRDAIDNCLLRYQPAINAKKLSLTDTVERHQLTLNRRLFEFVLSSVLDNAIRYNHVDGSIIITADHVDHQLEISITNNGGISLDKRAALFQPTNNKIPESARYGDVGLSLFLDKIIMDHLGGSIDINVTSDNVTVVTIRI